MSLDFGKVNFYTSLKPTSAFPLDARTYFESKVEADAAVATAKEAGSKDSVYYIGQDITVLTNNKPMKYVIQPSDDTHSTPYLSKIEAVGEATGYVAYLSTRECIGENIELQDVYPIQHSSSVIKVVSKNRLDYSPLTSVYPNIRSGTDIANGIKLTLNDANTNTAAYIVSGTSTGAITGGTYIDIGKVDFDIRGKYSISLQNSAAVINSNNQKCYITYSLSDANGALVQASKILTSDNIVIDTKELNCQTLKFQLFVYAHSGQSINAEFNIQVEFGEKVTEYTRPRTISDCAGKFVDIYGKNLVKPETALGSLPTDGFINDISYDHITSLGVHYFKSTMPSDYDIVLNGTYRLKTPLLKNDKFTLIYNVVSINEESQIANISDIQVVYGHTDYEEYLPYEMDTLTSIQDGLCDISYLKYPYTFISLRNTDESTEGLAIYVKYDPALSRDWTEKELAAKRDKTVSGEVLWEGSIAPSATAYISVPNIDKYTMFLLQITSDDLPSETLIAKRCLDNGIEEVIQGDASRIYNDGDNYSFMIYECSLALREGGAVVPVCRAMQQGSTPSDCKLRKITGIL